MPTVDYPKNNLTFILSSEFVDSLYVDDQFWMYVVYFTGNAANPTLQRPLGRLRWNWAGLVVFDLVGSNRVHNRRYTNAPPASLTGQPTTSMVNMQGQLSFTDVPCPGGPPLTSNNIDSSRVLVKNYYPDNLKRQADAGGWDAWTSVIAQCVFDLNCIQTTRVNVALWFFWSPEGIQKMGALDPIMASPPGSPNFNAAEYNPRFVYWCYQKFLGRDPDQPAYDSYISLLNSNGDYDQIIYSGLPLRPMGPVS